MKNLTEHKKIAIIGGGPVGLTTAKLLQMKGADVTVYERDLDRTARITGGTLDLHKETGQKALKKAGLLAAFYQHSRPTAQRVADKNGNVIFEMKPDKSKPEIDRPDLRKILLDSLAENTVVWDCQIISIDKKGELFELQFQNGTVATADLVIIADGGMSKARRYITDALPEETGTYIIQGDIANVKESCPNLYSTINNSNLAIVEDKKTIFLHFRGDGSSSLYISFRKSSQWLKEKHFDFNDTSSIKKFLSELFKDWNHVYNELFNASSEYMGFTLKTFHVNELLKPHSSITLVGDAAHLMPPWGGQGVNMGMKDALILTENLTSGKFPTIQSAIENYEQQMIAYAAPLQKETHAADDRIHHQIEHSFNGFKDRIKKKFLKVVQYIALFFLLLVTGVFWGNWFSFSRSYDAFSATELTHIAQVVVQNLAMPMRFISATCLAMMALTAYLIPQKKSSDFYFVIASMILLISSLLLTVIIEVPINNQILSWTPATLPPDWQEIRNHWQFINIIRTFISLVGFGFFSAAILKPFDRKS